MMKAIGTLTDKYFATTN